MKYYEHHDTWYDMVQWRKKIPLWMDFCAVSIALGAVGVFVWLCLVLASL